MIDVRLFARLLLHGFPQTWQEWRHVIQPIAEAGYRVVAPDYRGAGGESAVSAACQYVPAACAEYAAPVRQSLDTHPTSGRVECVSMDCYCPRCASGHTQRLSIIYESGLVLHTRGHSMQTAASSTAAPPQPMSYAGPLVVIFVIFVVVGNVIFAQFPPHSWIVRSTPGNWIQAAFLFLPMIAWVVLARRYNTTTWRRLRERWRRSFRCNRCGQAFLIPASA